MKKYRILQIIVLLVTVSLTSCEDYLDVQPADKFLESDLFKSEAGVNSALNGVYLGLTDTKTYGGNFTMSTVELLGQRFKTVPKYTNYLTYTYTATEVKANIDDMWSGAYSNIVNINKFIENLSAYSGVIGKTKENILIGEAYGLRAMIHLDLLRLFGPIYSVDSTAVCMPYYREATAKYGDLLPAYEVMNNILIDLDSAEKRLAADPIITKGKQESMQNDGNDFYRFRNLRMNLYAVKALQARAHLYAGHKAKALRAAVEVIDEASQWFTWTPPTAIVSAGQDPDRIFSSEVLFALQNVYLYDRHAIYYSSNLQPSDILAPLDARLTAVFETNENDYRYNSTWATPVNTFHTYKTFYKFADIKTSTKPWRYMQPLIRITEMYYIAAETETDATTALYYLNTVRYNRGLTNLAAGTNIDTELRKEYQKEFYGEGQLFYYYKRKNITTIPNASTTENVTMNAAKYILPLPESETLYR